MIETSTIIVISFAVLLGVLIGAGIRGAGAKTVVKEVERELHLDEGTMIKVRDAIKDAGMGPAQAEHAITNLQNAGILFRERKQ